MTQEQLSYLNAFIVLAQASSRRLVNIAKYFNNDWHAAWESKLRTKFLPEPIPHNFSPEKEWIKLMRAEVKLIPFSDPDYPTLLKQIKGAPIALYLQGNRKALNRPCISVVGCRAMTEYGQRATRQITTGLAAANCTIVSGLAMGVDGVAHQSAIEAGVPTVAVLGGPLDGQAVVSANLPLARKLLKSEGALVSELPMTIHASRATFPERNRIVSGLSLGTVVTEAAEKSGALITARLAAEQGRDVFAVPGSIFSKVSQGTNNLIRQGAKIVLSAEDVLNEYPELTSRQPKLALTSSNPTEAKILRFLSETPRSLNELVRLSNLTAPLITASLMNLELNDKVINLGGNRYTVKN